MKLKLVPTTYEDKVQEVMQENNISNEEAKDIVDGWSKEYDEAQKYTDELVKQLEEEQEVKDTAVKIYYESINTFNNSKEDFHKNFPNLNDFNLAEYMYKIYNTKEELDMNLIQYIFSLDINYETTTNSGLSAFCIGLLLKNIELTKLFISKGIDIKSPITYKADRDKYFESEEYKHYYPFGEYNDYIEVVPFNFACMTNYYENIVILIENGISINTPIYHLRRLKIGIIDNDESITICNLALDWNNIELMGYLIKNSEFNDENNKLLIKAVGEYKLEMIELLLSHKKNSTFFADLTKVIEYRNLPLLKRLVDSGAELNEEDNDFVYLYSFLAICIKKDEDYSLNPEYTGLKLMGMDENEKYFKEYSYLDIAKFLLENGINPNQGNINPLMLSFNIVDKLFVNTEFEMNYGHKINYTMANLLIENGADINYCDNDGKSILMSACEPKSNPEYSFGSEKKISLINLLIQKGANVNHKDKNANSVIMHIGDGDNERKIYKEEYTDDGRVKDSIEDLEVYPSERILKILLDNGAEINHKNYMGITPLMHYSLKGEDKLVKILLENGADINVKSEMTAFDLAKTDEIKTFIKQSKNNSPQRLVKLLSNFTIDKPIKYTTHDWDFGELKKEYGNFDGYMNAVKKQFDSMKNELEELSPNLYKKIYTFLIDENPDENYSWCHKTYINIGWSSLIGLKEYCDSGNKPDNFILPNSIFYEGNDLTTFKDVINLFKQEIEIRENFKNLEILFTTQKNKLGTGRNSIFNLDLSTAKLNRQFYTDVEKFSNVLDRIFGEIKIRKEFPNIEVITTEFEDRSIEIKIVHIDSFSNKSASDLLKDIENGDFAEIKVNLSNLCDWSIESSFENENFKINYLHSNNVKEIVSLDEKPKGFTHIFRFYK